MSDGVSEQRLSAPRLMQVSDIPAVLRVQAECYVPHINESETVIRRRLDASPDTAWVLEAAGAVIAYLVGYRSSLGKVTPLGGHFETPETPDCLYLHDLAVSRRGRGKGAAVALVNRAFNFARHRCFDHLALVSVQDSRRFWERMGFRYPEILLPEQHLALESYLTPCSYMVCPFGRAATGA